jgi:hypothetical protein
MTDKGPLIFGGARQRSVRRLLTAAFAVLGGGQDVRLGVLSRGGSRTALLQMAPGCASLQASSRRSAGPRRVAAHNPRRLDLVTRFLPTEPLQGRYGPRSCSVSETVWRPVAPAGRCSPSIQSVCTHSRTRRSVKPGRHWWFQYCASHGLAEAPMLAARQL